MADGARAFRPCAHLRRRSQKRGHGGQATDPSTWRDTARLRPADMLMCPFNGGNDGPGGVPMRDGRSATE
eukprot:15457046-Alexandrium_andersonii.AAC.1